MFALFSMLNTKASIDLYCTCPNRGFLTAPEPAIISESAALWVTI